MALLNASVKLAHLTVKLAIMESVYKAYTLRYSRVHENHLGWQVFMLLRSIMDLTFSPVISYPASYVVYALVEGHRILFREVCVCCAGYTPSLKKIILWYCSPHWYWISTPAAACMIMRKYQWNFCIMSHGSIDDRIAIMVCDVHLLRAWLSMCVDKNIAL